MRTSFSLICAAALGAACGQQNAPLSPEQWTLDNGIRVICIPVPDSASLSIFTFLPLGLAWDGAGKAQWSHLVEHMVIRSTHPAGSAEANAETLPDHMRLDFYGAPDDLERGLTVHAEWLEGKPFDRTSFEREKAAANSECDNTAANEFTHKFALAAWGQAVRHGRSSVEVKGELARATFDAIRNYRDERLWVRHDTVMCVIGGVTIDDVRAQTETKVAGLASESIAPPPGVLHPEINEIHWDLPTRHVILTWAIPEPDSPEFAAAYAFAATLGMRFVNDTETNAVAANVLTGVDLRIPEGRRIYVNAVCKQGASPEQVASTIEGVISARQSPDALGQLPGIARQLAFQLDQIQHPAQIRAHAGSNVTEAMIEGNIGLQWGMNEFRFGRSRDTLVRNLRDLNAENAQVAIAELVRPEARHTLYVSPNE